MVISGGEPSLWSGLLPLLEKLKEAGLPAKIDTNGTTPSLLRAVTKKNLAQHIAMDVKAPLDAASYSRLAGVPVDMEKIIESIKLIKSSAPSYEFRTTYVPALHSAGDLLKMRGELSDDAHWVVQCFKPNGCLDEKFLGEEPASAEKRYKNSRIARRAEFRPPSGRGEGQIGGCAARSAARRFSGLVKTVMRGIISFVERFNGYSSMAQSAARVAVNH